MDPATVTVREAVPADGERLLAVYAPYVRQTAVSFDYEVPTVQAFSDRIASVLAAGHPFLVAEEDGVALGYACLGPFVGRAAYGWNAETSIYVHWGARGRGIGRALHGALERAAAERSILALEACIGVPRTADDPHLTDASRRFHRAMGYSEVGRFESCGYKFGRWYDMVWMEKRLAPAPATPPRPTAGPARDVTASSSAG